MSFNPAIHHRHIHGEPYLVGGLRFGTVYPDGGIVIDLARHPIPVFFETPITEADLIIAAGAIVKWFVGDEVRFIRIATVSA